EQIRKLGKGKQPFFFALNFWGPHAPYHATREFLDWYADVEIPPWPNYEWPSREIPGPHHLKIHWDNDKLTWEDWAMAVRYYYARISMIDSQIGRLYDYLKESGELDNTVLIFTADHGETLGSHGGLLDKGWHHFEETHHVPLIIRFPDGSQAGERISEFASLADMYPTVLDLVGGEYDQDAIHGTSLLPLIRGEKTDWRDAVVTEFLGLGNVATSMKMLRMGNLKYGCNLTSQDELYDLEKDPHEMNNVIDDPAYAEDVARLKARLKQWMVETNDPALRMYRWREREGIG
ncbi:MAG: sulfatase-like hydrolase/transferase, partial [Candidatus Latescibacteria bacterium]|nr:sulfatase-like hydrolase/transferase [Candidatus Latescibacterota bacterium]